VAEPWLYGQSVGLSPIAVILAVIFWTWLWGAVGLVLATPLTVCLVVVGKYISGLAVFDQLLGERTPLQPHLWLYQRLLARDEHEAGEVLDEYAAEHTVEQTCEGLLLPTLLALKHDLTNGRIGAAEGDFVAEALLEIIDEFSKDEVQASADDTVLLIGLPPHDRLDEIALRLLAFVMNKEQRHELMILSADQLVGERIAEVEKRAPAAVCMTSLPPGDLAATRSICKRLRQRMPGLGILVGRLGASGTAGRGKQMLLDAGASRVVDTLQELRDAAAIVVRTENSRAAPPAPYAAVISA
jgi:hypothetical protein